jgi:hypothetical protein
MSKILISQRGTFVMFKASAIMGLMIGMAMCVVVPAGSALTIELADGQIATAKDLDGLAQMQKNYEQMRNEGKLTSPTLGELAYYYSEKVPVSTKTMLSTNKREVDTIITDCRNTPGLPSSPKFLYGGLDPYALIARAESDGRTEDFLYANFFPATKSDLGTCANFSTLDIDTGSGTTKYVVLFKSAANKTKFDDELSQGIAPMPAAGFWCLWGLGGSKPHFAVPNNPQFAVYKLDSTTRDTLGLDSTTYIGANYWLRIHGMGSPYVLGRISNFMQKFERGEVIAESIKPNRFKSFIFHDPLDPQ